MRKNLILFLSLFLWLSVSAQQNFWAPVSETEAGAAIFQSRTKPGNFKLFRLQEQLFKADLTNAPSERVVKAGSSSFIINIPNPDGELELFRAVEAPVMHPDLAARYPSIKSYAGRGVQNPARMIRFDASPLGFHAVVFTPGQPTYYIDPVDHASQIYLVVSRKDLGPTPQFQCDNRDDKKIIPDNKNILPDNADDATLRTYRLALAASGEYSARWLDGTEANDGERRTKILAAMNNNITRSNAILERDFAVRLLLIANTDDIIYLDASSDPWTSTDSDILCDETEATMNTEIGAANYDIGHLVHEVGNFGKAGCIGCVCSADNTKGRGFTSRNNWNSGNGFEEYILVHEIGHQFDANHTFTHADDNDAAQMEPGSGSTIMSYAGITGASTDIQSIMDDYYHAISIEQATNYIKGQTCNGGGASGNDIPTADAGANYTIPKSTPFKLTGIGTDEDEINVLTYIWEQMDKVTDDADFPWLPSPTHTYGPEFRSLPPTTSNSRTFPVLANILDGSNTNKWEKLPSVGRTLNFRFTVRDNNPGAGGNESDNMVLTVDGATGPFAVTSPNTTTTWCPGSRTVTWSVNGSDVHAANVNIYLSYDGGLSFPVLLAGNTPNDGSHVVNIPCTGSTMGRIKVEAVGNVFFDISNANFTVGDNVKPTFTVPANVTIYKDADCNYNASPTLTGDVTDESDNCDNSLNATYVDATAPGSCVGETILTRTWTLLDDCGNSTVKQQTITITDNTPPTFTEPDDITIYKDENCDHDASVGVTGDVTNEDDNCDNTLNATFTDVVVPGDCIGEEVITRTWSLTDDCGNNTSKIQVINVRDTTRPVISGVSANPNVLWPPNHKMRDVVISYTAVDNCSPVTNVLSVTSNEPIDGTGDGDTSPDWEVIDDHNVRLRAERAGSGNGRIYTITITSTDDCGNVATTTTTVVVPHNNITGPVAIVSEEKPQTGLQVKALPNPSNSNFAVTVTSENDKDKVLVSVFDLFGRRIEDKWMNSGATIVLGENLRAGSYLLRITQGTEIKTLKIVKMN
jgi:hypothetical protein